MQYVLYSAIYTVFRAVCGVLRRPSLWRENKSVCRVRLPPELHLVYGMSSICMFCFWLHYVVAAWHKALNRLNMNESPQNGRSQYEVCIRAKYHSHTPLQSQNPDFRRGGTLRCGMGHFDMVCGVLCRSWWYFAMWEVLYKLLENEKSEKRVILDTFWSIFTLF